MNVQRLFAIPLIILTLFVLGVVFALLLPLSPSVAARALTSPETLFALKLSLLTSLAATAMAILLGVPAGALSSQKQFPGKVNTRHLS